MIYAYGIRNGELFTVTGPTAEGELPQAVWIDVVNPTPDDDKRLLGRLGIDIPTQDEMKEIEPSSRLYEEGGALYMTALLTWNADKDPQNTPVAFVITPKHLVTVRYEEPQPFRSFMARCTKQPKQITSSTLAFVGLTEVIVDRAADLLERCGAELDAVSADIFRQAPSTKAGVHLRANADLEGVIRRIGRQYDLASKARESLVSLGRAVAFFRHAASSWMEGDAEARIKTVERDIRALAEHDTYLSQKTNFLLDATLGLISNDQNKVIKIFSVVAVIFLPPTLVASIYGMNFDLMPDLHWPLGYPMSLALMVLSAILPYLYFKKRGWL